MPFALSPQDLLIVSLFLLGLGMLWLEMFLPGGVVGVGGLAALIAGIALTFAGHGLTAGAVTSAAMLAVVLLMVRHWMRTFNRSFLGSRMTNPDAVGADDFIREAPSLLGARGTTLTSLQPAGKARFGERKLDVVAEVGVIPPGTNVEVIRVDGIALRVRPIPEPGGNGH
jgi:membrane-bound serine protease (ClpP class)